MEKWPTKKYGDNFNEYIEKKLIDAMHRNSPKEVYEILVDNWDIDITLVRRAKEMFRDYEPIQKLYPNIKEIKHGGAKW